MRPLAAAALLWAVPLAAQAPAARPATLREAYALALAASDSVASSEQSLRQAEALYRQALGGSLPELSLRHQQSWQGRQRPEYDGALRASWNGLNGYRELSALRSASAVERQRRHLRRRAEQLLLGDVAGAFYGYLQARENARATDGLIVFAEKRLAELRERVRVGRAREADAIGQEVQLQALRSQLEESRRQVDARADLLAFFLREPVEPVVEAGPQAAPRPALESYLSRVEERPDVAAAVEAVRAAEGTRDTARAARLPQVSATADYFGYRSINSRNPVLRERDRWNLGFTASMPIWSWGARAALTEAAEAVAGLQAVLLRATRRAADLDVRNAHRDHAYAERQLAIRRRAQELARRDYELQTRDERRGLVTSLEVLESLNRLNAAELDLQSAVLAARLASVGLEIAAGADPASLEPPR
jgi:outer membrane protein TolC